MRSSRYLTSAGFALMLALMLGLLFVGFTRMSAMDAKLAEIALLNEKIGTVTEMRNAARERALLLHRYVSSIDPFEQDELLQTFNAQARRFILGREALTGNGLNREEEAILQQALVLARQGETAQSQVLELMQEGAVEEAHALLVTRVVEVQNRVMSHMNALVDYEKKSSDLAASEARQAYSSALAFMLAIGAGFLVVGVGVATYVIRGTNRIEADLHREKELAEVTLHSIGDAVVTTDVQGHITYLNPVAEFLSGWQNAQAAGHPLEQVFHIALESDGEPLFAAFDPLRLETHAAHWQENTILVAKDGSCHATELSVNPIRNARLQTIGAVLVLRDVTRARALSKELSWAASHDSLTGLINRSEFERQLASLLQDARNHHRSHALLYMDLDQFKIVNDTCGHMAGDELLRRLTMLLEDKVRQGDTLARLGGDEFGVLLEGCPLDKAIQVAEALRDAVADYRFIWDDKPFDVGVSIGLAPITAESGSANELLSAVDTACYVAKDLGRNRVHVFEPDDQELSRRTGEMVWSQRVSQAIKEGRFSLYVQKIMPLAPDSTAPAHMELLIRMTDETGEPVPPMSFIPAAERYGLMPQLDRWVIQNVFERLSRRETIGPGTTCTINLSGQSFNDPQMLPFIREQFQNFGIPPEHICFEVTETAAVANLRAATHFIEALRKLGCRFALDDFGSGMSSFGYLRHLKVDYLKIDGSFVKDMLNDPTDRAMVEAIHHIGHVMGLRTIAEYVENEATAELLREIGVDFAQGYGIHRPEPIDSIRPQ